MSLNQVSLFGAGFAVVITADMVEGEEQMMLLVELSWQLNLILRNKSTNKQSVVVLTHTHEWHSSPSLKILGAVRLTSS